MSENSGVSETPYKSFEASKSTGFPYWLVDIRLNSGDVIRGYVVPEHLKDKLPGPLDGVPMWTNPMFPERRSSVMSDAELLDRVRRFATLPDDDRVYESEFMRGFTVGDASCRKQLWEILGIEE